MNLLLDMVASYIASFFNNMMFVINNIKEFLLALIGRQGFTAVI